MLVPDLRQEVSLGRKLSDSESSSCFAIDEWLRRRQRDRLEFGIFGLRKPVGCNARAANVRSEDFWQFTKAKAVLFRIWQVRD